MDGQRTMTSGVVGTKHDLISGICALILKPKTIKKLKGVKVKGKRHRFIACDLRGRMVSNSPAVTPSIAKESV